MADKREKCVLTFKFRLLIRHLARQHNLLLHVRLRFLLCFMSKSHRFLANCKKLFNCLVLERMISSSVTSNGKLGLLLFSFLTPLNDTSECVFSSKLIVMSITHKPFPSGVQQCEICRCYQDVGESLLVSVKLSQYFPAVFKPQSQ